MVLFLILNLYMLNWIILHRTVYAYKNEFGINNLQWLMYHKTKQNPTKSIQQQKLFNLIQNYWNIITSRSICLIKQTLKVTTNPAQSAHGKTATIRWHFTAQLRRRFSDDFVPKKILAVRNKRFFIIGCEFTEVSIDIHRS